VIFILFVKFAKFHTCENNMVYSNYHFRIDVRCRQLLVCVVLRSAAAAALTVSRVITGGTDGETEQQAEAGAVGRSPC